MSEGKRKEMRDKNQNIQVFVRIRPVSSQEKAARSPIVVETPAGNNKEVQVVEKSSLTKNFSFDRVFGTNSKQVDVYKVVAAPLVDEVLAGYNCTVFAYGQTGTGKTFTMEGERHDDLATSWENDPYSGIIPRTLSHLFDELRIQEVECTVRVSFIEIYNEDIYDLLSGTDDTTKLRLYDDTTKKGSVIIQGMEEVTVHNKNEVYSILAKGSLKRQTAATLMNAHSSRSHTIFSITVHIKENTDDGEELMKIGKLNLVDLAGSENIGRSGAVERRAREAGNINQSLLTLGRVITSLVERAPHIPYRESKLTRLLQDSLGGRTKTSIIATISPAAANLEETLSTLDYAHRAKNITNRPEVNQKLTKKALLKEYTEEIERLRRDLLAAREKNGVYMAQENYEQITREIELQRKEIVEKLEQIKAMEEEQTRKEESCQQLQGLYDEQQTVLHATAEELNSTKHNLSMTRSKLKQTRRQRDEKGHVLLHQTRTEQQLGTQARELLKVADVSTDHVGKLHSKLDRKRSVEKENERINQEFRQSFAQNVARMEDSLENFVKDHTKFLGELSISYGTIMAKQSRDLSVLSELMSSLVKSQSQFAEGLRKAATDSTHSTQEFTKSFLGTTRTQVNAQVANQNQFLVDNFLPKFQTVSKALQEQGQAVQQLQRSMTEELQQQADLVNVLLTEQKDGMNRLRQVAQQWDQQTESHLRRVSEQQTLSSQTLSEFDAESNKQMQMIINLVNSVQQTRENFKSRINDTNTEVSNAVQMAQQERSNFYHVVETTANDFVNKGKDLRSQLETARSTLLQTATASLEKGVGRMQDTSKTCAVIEGDVSSHVTSSQAAWQELYSAQETDLRKHSDHLNGALLSHAHLTTESLHSLHVAAQTQEALLEEQRADMVTTVRERRDDVEAHTSSMSDWSSLLSTEIRQRNGDVVKFIVEDMRHDVATGQTPQRREFGFPRFLASTSPHERIIERFHEERGPYNTDDEDDDDAEFSQLSRRHTGSNGSSKIPAPNAAAIIHRSASMNDLANPVKSETVGASASAHGGSTLSIQPNGSHRTSTGESHGNAGLIRTLSVEGSLNSSNKDNKENFAVPQDPIPVGTAGAPSSAAKKLQRQQSGQQSGRKILNSQNTKSS